MYSRVFRDYVLIIIYICIISRAYSQSNDIYFHSNPGNVNVGDAVLISQLILIDPVILSYSYRIIYKFLQKAGLMKIHPMVRGALMRRNTWEDQNEAVEYFERKKLFRNISKNIIEDYVTGGLKKNIHQKFELSCRPEWEAANFRLSPDEIGFNLKKSNIPIKLILPPNSYVCNKESQRKLERLMPNIEIVNIKNTSHMLPLENFEAVSDEINKFLI